MYTGLNCDESMLEGHVELTEILNLVIGNLTAAMAGKYCVKHAARGIVPTCATHVTRHAAAAKRNTMCSDRGSNPLRGLQQTFPEPAMFRQP